MARDIPTIANASVIMLPVKPGAVSGDFLIEDYFKKDKVKELGKAFIDRVYNGTNFKKFPQIKEKMKNELLPGFCPTATDVDMEDFKTLLDLLENTLTA